MKEEKHWILLSKKIAGEATPEELEQLRDLFNADSEWKAVLENLQEFWISAPVDAEGVQTGNEEAYQKHINRLKLYVSDFSENDVTLENKDESFSELAKKPFYKSWMTYALLAGFITVIVLLYPSLASNNTEEKATAGAVNEIAISPGSKSKIQLPDGSQVWINSGSKLTYSGMMKGHNREVTLDGEAYFDIIKDPSHPFIVHTSGIDIKVLGTAFNVKAYKIEPTIEATLIHGSIEVTNRNRPDAPTIMLKPREKLVFSNDADAEMTEKNSSKVISLSSISTEKKSSIFITPLKRNIADSLIAETAWIYNKLAFEDKPFEELALDMERWYNVKFVFKNKKVASVHLTGSFTTETIEQALEALQFLVNFKYTITNGSILIE